jgi:hypothetical protein
MGSTATAAAAPGSVSVKTTVIALDGDIKLRKIRTSSTTV